MILYPAIDCRSGRCVRLYQGDYQQETIYGNDPVGMAQAFLQAGATGLHVVDLDGAKSPEACQTSIMRSLLQQIPLPIQLGGGMRTEPQVAASLEAGAARVIIGSLAVREPRLVASMIQRFGASRIVLAVDIAFDRTGTPRIATHAWQTITDRALFPFLQTWQDHGLTHVLCTDISRDGTLTGPNMSLYTALRTAFPGMEIQASGGIATLEDIRRLKASGIGGAIIGKALYEGRFTLEEALSC